jgi:hypothetical protein
MIRQIIYRAIVTITVILAVGVGTQAQSVLQRARQAAEKTVQSAEKTVVKEAAKTTTVAEQAKEAVADPVTNVTAAAEQPAAQPQREQLKPSADAIKNDPAASDTKVREGYTRSPAEIRAGYEAINEKWVYQPYWHPYLKNWYITDEASENRFMEDIMTMEEHARIGRKFADYPNGEKWQYLKFRKETIPAGNPVFSTILYITDDLPCVMPVGLSAISAGLSLFVADPQGIIPFMRMCEATNALNSYSMLFYTGIDPNPNRPRDGKKVKLNAAGDVGVLPAEEMSLLSALSNIQSKCSALSSQETPLSVKIKASEYYLSEIQKYEADNNYAMMRTNLHFLNVALRFWKGTIKADEIDRWGNKTINFRPENDPDYQRVLKEANKYERFYQKWAEMTKVDEAPVEMPKTFDMGAALANRALEIAKKQMAGSYNVDKVVFLTNSWKEHKESTYPYRMMFRSLEVALLTNDNGKWVMREYSFRQVIDNSGNWKDDYSFMTMGSGNPRPVKYP